MSGDNILVAIKSRPLITRETSAKLRPQWSVQDETIFQIDEDGHRVSEPYSFDHIFTEYITNANVYNTIVESLVKSFLNGFNSTIFAYGQTSSGKTHTMMGTDNIPGIIQLAISDVFQHVSHNINRRYLISCSYFEIYNEKINDLLDKRGQDLKIREDFCGNTFVNAKEEVVTEAAEVYELMKVGSKIRKIGCTNMNERSSRSHTIFRLTIKSTENNIEHGPVQISYLNLVDLAGSERIAHTKAAGVRLKEGVNINKSLLALGNVIRQLSEGEGFINYRDSNLTRLLQHALGGNAKSLIIATITIAAGEETKSTLEFAQRAKVVKNKPIINEILSEQDKLKQNKLETANYKNRLEKMMQEKEEREKEILKLKQQIKLIDLFTNGPDIKKTESHIPRRHTMGHYTSRIPLQTIPEGREKSIGNGTTCDADEELFLKRASEISDYDYIKMVVEESLEDVISSVTPEPSEELLVQEEMTSTPQLRERLKYLEESYSSLQEFTKLETQFKEGQNVIQELVKEKENLLKDLVDMNGIIKDTRQEKEQMKIKFEEELTALKNDLEQIKKQSDQFSFALEQAEAEKDALRLAKEQLLNDNEVLLEQQRLKYENQLQYFTNEIKKLNEQEKENHNFEEEIQRLRNENENIKSNTEKITIYEEKIIKLEEKLQKVEKEEEEDCDILSVSTQTEEITSEVKEPEKAEIKDTIAIITETVIQKEYDDLKDEMQKLNDKLEHMQSLNVALEEELHDCKERNASFFEIEISNCNMKNDIAQKQEEIDILLTKVRNLENDNQNQKYEIDVQKEHIQYRDIKITELTNKTGNLEKDNHSNEEKIKVLLNQIENLEEENENQKKTMEEVKLQNENIINLKDKIECLEKTNESCEDKILYYKEQIQSKDNDICELTSKIGNLETNLKSYMENINVYKNEIDLKTSEIVLHTERMTQIENDINKYQAELESSAKKIKDQENLINNFDQSLVPLEEKIKTLETENKCYKKDIQVFRKEVPLKDNEIMDLKSKLDAIQTEQSENVADLVLYKNEIELRNNEITVLQNKLGKLEKDNENYKQEIHIFKQEAFSKDKKITTLTDKVVVLENDNQKYKAEAPDKEDLIQKIEHLQEENKIHKEINIIMKEEINVRDRVIFELNNTITNLEKMNFSNKEDIQCREENILKLNDRIATYQSETETNVEKVSGLNNKIENLETENRNIKSKLNLYEDKILDLTNKLKHLEKCNDDDRNEIQTKNNQIFELKIKMEDLEKSIQNNKEYIQLRDTKILELTDKIEELEECNNNNIETIQTRDNQILELSNKTKDLEKYNQDNKKYIQTRNSKILELTNEIIDLENHSHSNKELLRVRDSEILDMRNKINILERQNYINEEEIKSHISELTAKTEDNHSMKEDIQMKNEQISELKNTLASLEKQLLEFTYNIQNLEGNIARYKNNIQFRDDTIKELRNRISKLDESCHNYEDEVSQCKEEIFLQERKIKDLTEHNKDKSIEHKTIEDYNREDDIKDLKKSIVVLTSDKKKMDKLISDTLSEKDKEKKKNHELETRIKNMYLDNVTLRTKIFDLENVITELKSITLTENLEARNTRHSSASSSSMDLSPKELRKRKRQSIHDQRRGIDLAAVAAACSEEPAPEESSSTEKDLKEKIKKLEDRIEYLSNENEFLESEVQGFIRELDDCRTYKDERDKEIDMLEEKIEKMKKDLGQEDCKECPQKQHFIKKLEDLQRQNNFKIVELQTKIYDLQNAYTAEKDSTEERERRLYFHIARLETRLGDRPFPDLNHAGIQCDAINLEQLLEKYNKTKKLARMRRDEGNILRARLGIAPDEPIT